MFPIVINLPDGSNITISQDETDGQTTFTSNNTAFILLFGPVVSFNVILLPTNVLIIAAMFIEQIIKQA